MSNHSSSRYWAGKTDGGHRHSTEDWLEKYAYEMAAMLTVGGTLIDIGCGACQMTTYLAPKFERVYAIDFSETMLRAASQRISNLGITNIDVLSGTAQNFPKVISGADAILSYQVLQYLTLSDFGQHLHECRRVLNKGGMICAAMIPNSARRSLYYKRIIPRHTHFGGRAQGLVRFTVRRLKARFLKDWLWDGIGNWFSAEEIQKAASDVGFEVEFRNSWFYDYRFHALLWPR